MKRYTIIPAGIEHLKLIHDIAQVAFRDTYKDILSPEQVDYMMDWMYSLSNLRQQMDDGHVYYLAFIGEIPCGYLSIQSKGIAEDGRYGFHLHKIYIMPSEQGYGLGKMLFETALSHISTVISGHPATLELNVNRQNRAISFYEHLGLKILRQGDFHIGNGFYMNDYIMGMNID